MSALKDLPIEDKIKVITGSRDRKSCDKDVFPPVASLDEKYYFVSYNHEDYRSVYSDIYRLQEQGVPLWYDRNDFIPGMSWTDIAEKYIGRSQCIGVIFYISENTLKSGGIATEMQAIESAQKLLLPIELPLGNEFGKYARCDDLPIETYCERVRESITDEKLRTNFTRIHTFMTQHFTPNITYCPYSKDIASKAKQINDFGEYIQKQKVPSKDYQEGYKEGYKVGVEKGVNEGIEIGRKEGYQSGKKDGIELGKALGYQMGKAARITEEHFQAIISNEDANEEWATTLEDIVRERKFMIIGEVPLKGNYLIGEYKGYTVHVVGLCTHGLVDERYKYAGKLLTVKATEICTSKEPSKVIITAKAVL